MNARGSGNAPGSAPGARNLYRQRWSESLSTAATLTPARKGLAVSADILRVLGRFNGGMVYEAAGKKFVLAEHVFAAHPFLLVFGLEPRNEKDFLAPHFTGLPDEVLRTCRSLCEDLVGRIQLPKDLHSIEVDLTPQIAGKAKLPDGWTMVRAVLRLPVDSRRPGVACDCDVDGPCGYCCDVCDCNCYLCC